MKRKYIFSLLLVAFTATCASCAPTEPDAYQGYEINTTKAKKPKKGIGKVSIYAINDFHGAVKEDGWQMGLGYLASFMKQKTSEPNTLFIDSGDTWQGSLESNYNRGNLIDEVFENAKLSTRVIGNHDFDWGQNVLKSHVAANKFPSLAANVYGYDSKTKAMIEEQRSEFGKSYSTYVLDNGLKVGIIGVIGSDQITSISSNLVEGITFGDPNKEIKNVSDFLRTKKKCDIIIAATHASFDQLDAPAITKVSKVSNKRYVDLVLNAHTHKKESQRVNNVHFEQFGGYGEIIGNVELYYNFETNEVVYASTSVDSYSSSSVKSELNYKVDTEIKSIIDRYLEETDELGSQVLSTNFSGSFFSSEQLPNLMAEAVYSEAIKEGFTVDFAYTNYGRASHYNPTMTYSDLYNIFPFDNTIPIIEVTGKTAANMLRFNNCRYRANPELQIRYEGVYKVACLDYLAFHTDSNRDYDYFPEQKVLGYLTKNGENYTYREVLKDYLLANQDKAFESATYSFDNPIFAKDSSIYSWQHI